MRSSESLTMRTQLTLGDLVEDEDNPFQGNMWYKAQLEKSSGSFGLAYRADLEGLVITGIVSNSSADKWNHTADVDDTICVGDKIVAVGKVTITSGALQIEDSNCEALVQELRDADGLTTLTMLKFGPRWHIQGITARCFEQINIAIAMGMQLELVDDGAGKVEDEVCIESDRSSLSTLQFFMICGALAVPNIALIVLCSDIGMGFTLYSMFAPDSMSLKGNGLICISSFVLIGMYVVDWHKWKSAVERCVSLLIVAYAMAIGCVIKCKTYPQFPLVVILFHIPLFIGILRATAFKQVRRSSFYKGASVSTLLIGLSVLILWLLWMNVEAWAGNNQYNDATKSKLVDKGSRIYEEFRITVNNRERSLVYQWDCKDRNVKDFDIQYGEPLDNGYTLTQDEKSERKTACGQVKTIWFLLWISPFIATMCNVVIAIFCAINSAMDSQRNITKAEKALKQFVVLVFVLLLCMWMATSVAGASLRLTGTLMAFCAAGLIALFLWIYFEVGTKMIKSQLRNSKIMSSLVGVVTNDWFRACFLTVFGALVPAMFVIECVRQKVRRMRGTTESTAWLTTEAMSVLEYLRNWNWVGISIRSNWLVILYWTLFIGVARVTVVFLAWLNEEFEKNIDFIWVCFIFFAVGYTMFLLPPVPGIPVYITSGIVIAAQTRNIESIGFVGGIVIAVILSFVLKLSAVCGQYAIGFFMGKSVKIQQLVGVDQVFTRAIERILLQRGLGIGKVSVLVGGPDWPTSVVCGILNLSLFQCCLGTTPVIFVSSPCVLAGAFLAGPKSDLSEGEKNMWDALSNTALAVSAIVQLASGVLAVYFIQDVVSKHSEELSKHRPEHEKVKQLTIAEEHYQSCYTAALDWRKLPKPWLGVISFSVMCMLMSLFIFVFMDEACFRPFQVKDKISDPEGLNCPGDFGCALLRIVYDDPPVGWGALFLFALACVLHLIFLKYMEIRARKMMSLSQNAADAKEKPASIDSTISIATSVMI